MNVALVATCHPRVEIDFIAEWLKHYAAIGVDLIDLYIDPAYTNSPYRSQKPQYNYYDELTDEDAVDKFQESVASSGVRCNVKTGVADGGWGLRQAQNIVRTLDGDAFRCDYLLHLDVDEFLILKGTGNSSIQDKLNELIEVYGENHFGFYQNVMAPRWSEKSVWDIRLTKGCMQHSWKSAVNISQIGNQLDEGGDQERAYKAIHGRVEPHIEVPSCHANVFHFSGWDEGSRRQDVLDRWNPYVVFETTEHIVYRDFLLFLAYGGDSD